MVQTHPPDPWIPLGSVVVLPAPGLLFQATMVSAPIPSTDREFQRSLQPSPVAHARHGKPRLLPSRPFPRTPMPPTTTYPGAYIQEIPGGMRAITGVATSITAFIGRALRGPVNTPTKIQSFSEFEVIFGGLWVISALGYSIQQFFLNGGTDALIVRVLNDVDPVVASRSRLAPLMGGGTPLILEAASEGSWGDHLRARVERVTRTLDPAGTAQNLFNLHVKDTELQREEVIENVSPDPDHPRFVTRVLEAESRCVRVHGEPPSQANYGLAHLASAFQA